MSYDYTSYTQLVIPVFFSVFLNLYDRIRTNYAASSLTVDISADMWKPVKRDVKIPVELETLYLHVKTNSEVGSEDGTWIQYNGKEGRLAGAIGISFRSPRVKYILDYCQDDYSSFPLTLPTTVNKVWTIEKRGYRTRMFCNGVLVLDFTVSDTTCNMKYYSDWEYFWGREVGEIKFSKSDRASDMYMIG
jgi:hypothetical protein